MGLFSFFRKRKNKEQFDEVEKRYEAETLFDEQMEDESEVKRYILEKCEDLTQSVTELMNAKKEYTSITNYLKDIQVVETMDDQDKDKVYDIATNIMNLTKASDSMRNSVKRMPDSVYNRYKQLENDIPKEAKRLEENEKQQMILKRDLDYLEGEKVEWIYERSAIKEEQKILKKVLVGGMSTLALLLMVFMVVYMKEMEEAMVIVLIAMMVLVILECFGLIRLQNDKRLLKRCMAYYNKAVNIQNSVKLKYVNYTNAVDFAHEKYGVSSAEELNAQWQLYLEATKERERLSQAEDDLTYYRQMMVRLLRMYNLYDASIWPYQAAAIVDKKEMVEVKHSLLERRQKLFARIQGLTDQALESSKEVEHLSKDKSLFTPEVKRILLEVASIVEN